MRLNILDLLLPREGKFFDFFIEQSENLGEACKKFQSIMLSIHDMSVIELKKNLSEIKAHEKKGDAIERKILEDLHNTFITPIDREDIYSLVISIDKAMDILNSLSKKIEMYGISKVDEDVHKFCEIIVSAASELTKVLTALKQKKKCTDLIKSIHTFEKMADDLFHTSMANLFKNYANNPVHIIKFKSIYELLEDVVDAIDFVGKTTRGIIVKVG